MDKLELDISIEDYIPEKGEKCLKDYDWSCKEDDLKGDEK